MCKVNHLHVASEAGCVDGRNFALVENIELVAEIFSRQFFETELKDAYKSSFLAEIGKRLSPVNDVPLRQFAMR